MTEIKDYVRSRYLRALGIACFVSFAAGWNGDSLMASPFIQAEPKPAAPVRELAAGDGVVTSESIQQSWRVGVVLKGGPDETRNILATIPLPGDWPEQKVRILGKDAPPEVTKLSIRDTMPNFQQIVAVVPSLRSQQEIKVTYDLQVTLHKINAPETTNEWKIPKNLSKELKDYLDISPEISFRDAKLRAFVKELTKDKETAWDQVRALYEWVQAEVKPEGGDPTDSLECFRKRAGHPEDICGLFVAMCRAHKVPARMVWVIESQHTEFYLVDEQGKGRWFPVVFGGFTEFGSLSSPKLIEMKGDNFRVPEKKEPQKYVFENVTGEASTRPKIGFIREMIPASNGKGGTR